MTPSRPTDDEQLPPALAAMLAPLDRRAFGAALGTVCGLGAMVLTLGHVVAPPSRGLPLELLAQYWPGYRISAAGALIGAAWAFASGFVAGWLTALLRNLVVRGWVLLTRGRHELAATRDFLDRI